MAINLELPRKLEAVIEMAHTGAAEFMRPISRKYDLNEHAYPVELDTLTKMFEGVAATNTVSDGHIDIAATNQHTRSFPHSLRPR